MRTLISTMVITVSWHQLAVHRRWNSLMSHDVWLTDVLLHIREHSEMLRYDATPAQTQQVSHNDGFLLESIWCQTCKWIRQNISSTHISSYEIAMCPIKYTLSYRSPTSSSSTPIAACFVFLMNSRLDILFFTWGLARSTDSMISEKHSTYTASENISSLFVIQCVMLVWAHLFTVNQNGFMPELFCEIYWLHTQTSSWGGLIWDFMN